MRKEINIRRGGFYDAQVGFGGQTCHKFIEGEVK